MKYSLYFRNKTKQNDGLNYLNLLFLDEDFDYDKLTDEEYAEFAEMDQADIDEVGGRRLSQSEMESVIATYESALSEMDISISDYILVEGFEIEVSADEFDDSDDFSSDKD